METFSHLWQYLAKFFLQWEIFQINVVEKTKTHILYSVTFPENRTIYEVMSKNKEVREDADNMAPARGILDK